MSISNKESSFEPYVFSIKEQLEQHINSLNKLSHLSVKRPLSFVERSAVERSIQVIVETAIGCSKHYLKSVDKPVPSEARASIERVYEIISIVAPGISEMRGAIGMRNAIIHDYLNLDWQKLEVVLASKKYQLISQYVDIVTKKLISD